MLDSAIAAWSASLIATGRAKRLPLGYERIGTSGASCERTSLITSHDL